nr:adenosylcobinamide-GDP ribazoletransferase [uncultured Cohaesibacter sp.]
MYRTARALPLVGLFVAFIALVPATVFDVLALTSPLPSYMLAALTISMTVILTGGLHEDGLADVADGFWGGHSITRKLEIMKDSRLGSYGALALMLSLFLRISILGYLVRELWRQHRWARLSRLGACVACCNSSCLAHSARRARLNGLSASIGQPSTLTYAIGIAMGALVTALIVVPVFGLLSGVSAFWHDGPFKLACGLSREIPHQGADRRCVGGITADWRHLLHDRPLALCICWLSLPQFHLLPEIENTSLFRPQEATVAGVACWSMDLTHCCPYISMSEFVCLEIFHRVLCLDRNCRHHSRAAGVQP